MPVGCYFSSGLFQELLMASLFPLLSPYSILHEAKSQGDSLQCKLDDFTLLFETSQRFPLFPTVESRLLFKEYIKGLHIFFGKGQTASSLGFVGQIISCYYAPSQSLYRRSHRQYIDTQLWLCSNQT